MDDQMKAFAEHFNQEMNPGVVSEEACAGMAKFAYEQFMAFVKVGFTREEALHLITSILTTTLTVGMAQHRKEE